jgi:hypothetical protein
MTKGRKGKCENLTKISSREYHPDSTICNYFSLDSDP